MTNNLCPLCKKTGRDISRITVESLINDHFRKHLKSSRYHICKNPDCDTVYFNRDNNEIYFQRDIKVPVWFKNEINPIICYCNNVTLKDIINVVAVKKSDVNIEDVIDETGAMTSCHCKTMSPTGECCHDILKIAVDYALLVRDGKELGNSFINYFKSTCNI